MPNPPQTANLCLSVPVALLLVLCVALVLIVACGAPSTEDPQTASPSAPAGGPADVSPTTAAKVTIPVQEEAELVGMWAEGGGVRLQFGASGVYTQSYRSRDPDTGTWALQKDGSLELEGQSGVLVPHGNLLLKERLGGPGPGGTTRILHKVGEDGSLLAYEPSSPIAVPPIELANVLTLTILDGWTGFSPLAPIEAAYRLEATPDDFSGMAEFQVAGYTDLLTQTAPVSIPLAVVEELLTLLESTPLEKGTYKPLFSHTDDFPIVRIAIEGRSGDLEFATESQGSRHIPWRAVVGRDEYVTYADTPAQALDLLDPYLARDVQEALFELALERDPY